MFATLTNVLALSWQPEIRGISSVLLMFIALCGATYVLLGTNLGWRLGFLVAFAGFFGWMFLMGGVWWIYGIGLQGQAGRWVPVEVIQDGDLSRANTEIARSAAPVVAELKANALAAEARAQAADEAGNPDEGVAIRAEIKAYQLDDWLKLPEDDSGRGQAQASADAILADIGAFTSSADYIAQGVYRLGGDTWLLTFRHRPHYNLVEVQPALPQRTEPGQAPPRPVADAAQPPRYVLMIRDLGFRRRPAALITVGSGIIFGLSAMALHRRDKLVAHNRGTAIVKVG